MGLDIYFEKRSRNANYNEYRETCTKIQDVSNEIDKIFNGFDQTTIRSVYNLLNGLNQTELTQEIVELADKVRPHQERLDELEKKKEEQNPRKEIAYFRKVNLLMTFFEYEGNCEFKEIYHDEVELLIDHCERVLADHSLAQELLPTTGGFFFGSTEYSEWYFSDVENVLDTFKKILEETDWENEIVEMYCWW